MLSGRESSDGRHSLRVVLLDVVSERSEAEGGPLDVVVVHQPLADEHMHHAQSEGAVGARSRLEMEIGELRGGRAVGIDAHDEGAALRAPS